MKINVGDKAPDFTLPSQMGDNVTLSEYFGKKNIVLYFYPKDETRGCTREACEFRDSYNVFTSLGAEAMGVSSDTLRIPQVLRHPPWAIIPTFKRRKRQS
jgi:peroxiredoxin Q/BCP